MAVNDGIFSYGEITFVNATTSDNTPDFNYGELEVLYETTSGISNIWVNIENVWKVVNSISVYVTGAWKTVTSVSINTGTWKTVA